MAKPKREDLGISIPFVEWVGLGRGGRGRINWLLDLDEFHQVVGDFDLTREGEIIFDNPEVFQGSFQVAVFSGSPT